MNRNRSRWIEIGSLLIAGAFVGCASSASQPTGALLRARTMAQAAEQNQFAQRAPMEIEAGKAFLRGAEAEHEAHPRSNMEKHLANLAAAKFEIAIAEGQQAHAEARADAALQEFASRVLEQSGQGTAALRESLEAERLARAEAEGRAKAALDQLDSVARVEERPEGTVITLTGAVLFRVDESELLPIAQEKLTTVANALKEQDESVAIVIEGHADATGPEGYNEQLSQERAAAVKRFLADQGVDPNRVQTVGRGEKEPIATNATPEGRANNRRVEIIVQDEA
jgi:outer membrane protein OmpA-like peptidoglycan-associated protein